MASTTSNLGLTKPASGEAYSVDVFNQNFQKIDDRFPKGTFSTVADVVSFFRTYKLGTVICANAVTQVLAGRNRRSVITGFEISSEYIAYTLTDSNGEQYSGYITTANNEATYEHLSPIIKVSATSPSLSFSAGECKAVEFTFNVPSGYTIINVYDNSYYANLLSSLIRVFTGSIYSKATMNYQALTSMTHELTAVAVCARI